MAVRRNTIRRGFAANANAGIRESAGGRYVLLLNPDVICIAGLLDHLVAFLDAHPEAAIAAPQLYYPDGAIQPNVRRFPTPPRWLCALCALTLSGKAPAYAAI